MGVCKGNGQARVGEKEMGFLSNKISRDKLKPGDHIYSWRRGYIYAHHGIYVGEGNVIQFTNAKGEGSGTGIDSAIPSSPASSATGNPCPRCGYHSGLGGVISSCVDCFLDGGKLYLFKYGVLPFLLCANVRGTCTTASSDSPESVLHRAHYLLEKGFGFYHLSKNNCEDFAMYCKTSLIVDTPISGGRSGQAASFKAAAHVAKKAVIFLPLIHVAAMGSGGLAAVGSVVLFVRYSKKYCARRLNSDIGVRSDAVRVPVE